MAQIYQAPQRQTSMMEGLMDRYYQRQQRDEASKLETQRYQDAMSRRDRDDEEKLADQQLKGWMELVAKPLANDPDRLREAIGGLRERLPRVYERLEAASTMGPATPMQSAVQNSERLAQRQTEDALHGSQDAQGRELARQLIGAPMQKHVFEDQVQRQPGDEQYGKFVQRQGGDLTTADQDLEAQTAIKREQMSQTGSLQREREGNASSERIAASRPAPGVKPFPIRDQFGNVTGFADPSTGEFTPAKFDGRDKAVSFAERQAAGGIENMMAGVNRMEEIAKKNAGQIGRVQGAFQTFMKQWTDINPDMVDLANISGELFAAKVKEISGAAVTEKEAARLKQFLPTNATNLQDFFSRTKLFKQELTRIAEKNASYRASHGLDKQQQQSTTPDLVSKLNKKYGL